MKFLILAPFLLAPVLSQFGFIEDIANTVKQTAQSGAKAVQNVAIDGAHQVQTVGKDLIHDVQKAASTVVELEKNIEHAVDKTLNSPQPTPVPRQAQEPIQVPKQPKAPQVLEEKNTQNLQKQKQRPVDQESQGSDSQSSKLSESGRSMRIQNGEHRRHRGGRKHRKNRRPENVDPELIEQMDKCREQMKNIMKEFRQLKEQNEKDGKKITEQEIKQHQIQIKKLHQEMRELKRAVQQNLNQNSPDEVQLDIDQQRIILKEKIRQSKNMSHEERDQLKAEIKQKFEEIRQKQLQQGQRPQMRRPGQMGGVPEAPKHQGKRRGERPSQRGPRAARSDDDQFRNQKKPKEERGQRHERPERLGEGEERGQRHERPERLREQAEQKFQDIEEQQEKEVQKLTVLH